MKTTSIWGRRGVRIVASLSLAGLVLSQLPLGALFGTPALGQAQAIYTDPGDDDSGDFLGISGLSNRDVAQAGVIGLVIYGVVQAVGGGAGEAAAAIGGGVGGGTVAPVLPAAQESGDASKTIWDSLAQDSQGRFSQFVSATEVNGVKQYPLQDTQNGPYTAFAPTNGALGALPTAETTKLMDAASKTENEKVLQKHVVIGKYNIKDLEKLDSGFPLATTSGDTVTITKNPDGTVNVNGVPVIREDIKASNGVSHPVATVIK